MKLPQIFRRLSLEERISRELFEARNSRLAACSQREYLQALQDLYEARIARLEQELQSCLDNPNDLHIIGASR